MRRRSLQQLVIALHGNSPWNGLASLRLASVACDKVWSSSQPLVGTVKDAIASSGLAQPVRLCGSRHLSTSSSCWRDGTTTPSTGTKTEASTASNITASTACAEFTRHVKELKAGNAIAALDRTERCKLLEDLHEKGRSVFPADATATNLLLWLTQTISVSLMAAVPNRGQVLERVEEITGRLCNRLDSVAVGSLVAPLQMLSKIGHTPRTNAFMDEVRAVFEAGLARGTLDTRSYSNFLHAFAVLTPNLPSGLVGAAWDQFLTKHISRATAADVVQLCFAFSTLASPRQAPEMLHELDAHITSQPSYFLQDTPVEELIYLLRAFSNKDYQPSDNLRWILLSCLERNLPAMLARRNHNPIVFALSCLVSWKRDSFTSRLIYKLYEALMRDNLRCVSKSTARTLLASLSNGNARPPLDLLKMLSVEVLPVPTGRVTEAEVSSILVAALSLSRLRFGIDSEHLTAMVDAIHQHLGQSSPERQAEACATVLSAASTVGTTLPEHCLGSLTDRLMTAMDAPLSSRSSRDHMTRSLSVALYGYAGLQARGAKIPHWEEFVPKVNEFLEQKKSQDPVLSDFCANQLYLAHLVSQHQLLNPGLAEWVRSHTVSRYTTGHAISGDVAEILRRMGKQSQTGVVVSDGLAVIDVLLPDDKIAILIRHRGSVVRGSDRDRLVGREVIRTALVKHRGLQVAAIFQDVWDTSNGDQEKKENIILQQLQHLGVDLSKHGFSQPHTQQLEEVSA